MTILITGGTGFIGRHVLDQINTDDHEIVCITRDIKKITKKKNIEYMECELSDIEKVEQLLGQKKIDCIIHLAWEGIPDYSEEMSIINHNQNISFLNSIVKNGTCKKIIISGSCFEYGNNNGVRKEDDKLYTNSFFAWAKQSICTYSMLLSEKFDISINWFRLFYVYGPYQRAQSAIPTITKSIIENNIPDIRNPFNKIDLIHVKDVASAIVKAAYSNMEPGIYNIGTGNAVEISEVCKILEKEIRGKTNFTDELIDSSNSKTEIDICADMNKTEKALNWKPKYDIYKGIKDYLQFYNNKIYGAQ